VVISQGEVWWADLPVPNGSGPGFPRPIVVVQGDPLNNSAIRTVVCVAVTSNMRWADAPGNVRLPTAQAGLSRESVANVTQIVTLDRSRLTERVGKVPRETLALILAGIDVVFDRA
jgi:mRNA interferase MazF